VTDPVRRLSVVIPARNEGRRIAETVRRVRSQVLGGHSVEVEVVVVDDGSSDSTAEAARAAGARVVRIDRVERPGRRGGNPAAARNRGAALTSGDPIVFLDADCTPAPGWLAALLGAHRRGAVIVGGSLEMPRGLSLWDRCDYYSAWYHTHPRRPPGTVPNHPPANLSVRRSVFAGTAGFWEEGAVADGHEELAWQAAARRNGTDLVFEPRAMVYHHHEGGLRAFLRRSYRWGYSTIEAKSTWPIVRGAALYRRPWLAAAAAGPLAMLQALYVAGCWLRAGRMEPLLLLPALLVGRAAYGAGMTAGGLRWLLRKDPAPACRTTPARA
jgi:glycosyltransferase involved in cell wall biosynthesis